MAADQAACQRGILADILAEPQSDTARHVYADWLEEFGGAEGARRAEFVRAQLKARKHVVVVEPGWDGPPMAWTGVDRYWFDDGLKGTLRVYRRGFVCQIRLPLYDWFRRARELLLTLPLEEVLATDRFPFGPLSLGGKTRWLWFLAGEGTPLGSPHHLPREVWGLLPPHPHDDEASATKALSEALLVWAKGER